MTKSVIINVLPEGIEYTHEVFAFYSSIYGLKGAVKTFRKWCPRAFIPAGSKAPWLSLLLCLNLHMNQIRKLFLGRISRTEWVMSRLYSIGVLLVCFFIAGFIGIGFFESEAIAYIIMAFAYTIVLVVALSCDIRRIHDTGRNWKFILWNLIPFGILYYVFIVAFKKGDLDSNSYGIAPSHRATWNMLLNR